MCLGESSRRTRAVLTSLLATLLVAFSATAAHAATTTVSLQFDDGFATQTQVGPMLTAHGMNATFFVNTGHLGTPSYMQYSDLQALQAAGNEIGGHTLTHPDLTTLSLAQQTTQVCNDRANLLSHGLAPNDFAYPFGAYTPDTKDIVRSCGYQSAREVGWLHPDCALCAYANDLSTVDMYAIPAMEIESTTTLADLQGDVLGAIAGGGGWVPIFTHNVCDGCDASPALLGQFLDWLASEQASGALQVKTTQQVTDPTPPAVAITTSTSGATTTITAATSNTPHGVARVRFFADGKQLGTRTQAPYRWKWSTASVARGQHKVTAVVEDGSGATGASKILTVQVGDPTAPVKGKTYVTLGFDDGTSDQGQAVSALAARGMHGTFYVNTAGSARAAA